MKIPSRRVAPAVILLSLLCGCASKPPTLRKTAAPLTGNLMPEMERFITLSAPNRTAGSSGHEAAFQYIKEEFERIAKVSGGRVYVQTFFPDADYAAKNYQKDFDTLVKPKFKPKDPVYKKWEAFTDNAIAFVKSFRKIPGHNVILEIPGRTDPDDILYVGAHYDTITNDHDTLRFTPDKPAPGADDNTSSLVALLAAAREFAQKPHERTVRFVAFDDEEIFFLGSYALAKGLSTQSLKWMHPNENNLGLFNLEMIGWSRTPVEKSPVVKLYTRTPQEPGHEADTQLAQTFVAGALSAKATLTPQILANGFNRSDNWSFWQWSYPSVCVSEDWEKDFNEANYHTPNDKPETVNAGYLREITLSLMAALDIMSENPIRRAYRQR